MTDYITTRGGKVPVRIARPEPPAAHGLALLPNELAWLEKYRAQLLEKFPGQIEDIAIYGARARDNDDAEQEFNVLVVINEGDRQKKTEVHRLGYELDLTGYFVAPSVSVRTKAEWARRKQAGSMLYEAITREGVSVL